MTAAPHPGGRQRPTRVAASRDPGVPPLPRGGGGRRRQPDDGTRPDPTAGTQPHAGPAPARVPQQGRNAPVGKEPIDLPEFEALPQEDDAAPVRAALERLQQLDPDDPERLRLRDHVVESHLPLVRALAQRYRDLGEPLDDLVQVGTIGLIHAVDRFDAARGTGLASYATPNILGEIRRHFRDRAWAVRVPRRLQELQARTSAARAELAQRLGRSPTVAELAQALNLEEEAVLEALDAQRAYAAVPLERPEGQAEVDNALVTVDSGLDEVVDRESLRPVLRGLPARDKRILALRYFRGLSQAQIAEELGISQMHVSRLLARTLGRLQQCLADAGDAAAQDAGSVGRPASSPSPGGPPRGSGAATGRRAERNSPFDRGGRGRRSDGSAGRPNPGLARTEVANAGRSDAAAGRGSAAGREPARDSGRTSSGDVRREVRRAG